MAAAHGLRECGRAIARRRGQFANFGDSVFSQRPSLDALAIVILPGTVMGQAPLPGLTRRPDSHLGQLERLLWAGVHWHPRSAGVMGTPGNQFDLQW